MDMNDCPRFDICIASACPIWKPVYLQKHLNGERTCYYLLQAQKIDSEAVFKQSGLDNLFEVMAQATLDAFANPDTSIYLKKSLLKASSTSSAMAKGQNLIRRYRNGEFKKDEDHDAKV
jgi:hypothetical protein